MKTAQRVVWSEGLLIAPQHLQQLDLYHEQHLASRLDALEPLNWGLVEVSLDTTALGKGQVTLQELHGVLPDGLALALSPGHAELPPSRPIEGHFPHTQSRAEVFVGIPRERAGHANYTEDGNARARFTVEPRPIPDMTAAGQEETIGFGRRNTVLLFGDEARDDYEHIKIAEVVRDGAGNLVLDETYIPPILRIGASPYLVSGLRRVLEVMTGRRRALSEARRQRDASTVEFDATDVTRFLLLSSINTFLPGLSYMVEAGDVPPRLCYLQLLQLAGQLSTLSPDEDPTTFPGLVHTDLRKTFGDLIDRILAMLQATIKERYVSMSLQAREDGLHFGKLEDDRLLHCERYLLAVQTDLDEQQVSEQVPRVAKIASWQDINGLLAAATPGVSVQVTYRPPTEIPVKAGYVYFTLSTDNRYWRNALLDRSLAVYLPRTFDPAKTQVELLGIPPVGTTTNA